MKRLKFKKPFNGMDNAKKLIPESYKVDGNEFEITDGNETYRVKWSSLINEGIVLTSSNKSQINEDIHKMKHLMGFKSQDTLGTVKGAARLDENKKFGNILNKSKNLLNEGEHIKPGMGGSNNGKSRTGSVRETDEFVSDDKYYADYMDIAQIHPNTPLSMSTGENANSYELEKLGKEIVDTEYGGDIRKAYDTIVTNDNVRRWQEAYRELLATQRGGKRGLDEDELTPAQEKHIDLNNDGEIDDDDFEIIHQLNDLDKEAEKKKENNETHIKEDGINEIENPDVQKFGDKLNDNSTLKALISKINTPAEEIEAGVEMAKMLADSDPSILKRIARAITKFTGGDDSSSNPDETAGMGGIKTEQPVDVSVTNEALNEIEIADDYSERKSMAREYQENPEKYISTINSLLNEYIRKKGIPGDLGFVSNKNTLKGYDIALFSSPELLIDVAINSKFGFDVYYTQHVDSEDFDNIYGEPEASYHSPERMNMDTVANDVSFDQALKKVGELSGNDVSEANKISHRSIRGGGMGGNLESNPYNNKEVKGRPQGKALRQASKYEIQNQLSDMEPKDRFEEVFEGIYENVSEDVVEKFLKDFSNPETVKQVEEITKGYLIPYLEHALEGHEYSDGPGEGGGIDWKLSAELNMNEFEFEINNSFYSFLPELEHWSASQTSPYSNLESVAVNNVYIYDNDDNEIELNASVDARISKVLDNIALIIEKVYEHYTQDDVLSKIYSDQGGFDNYRDDYERYGVSRSDFT